MRTSGVCCETKLWIASVRLTFGSRSTNEISILSMRAMALPGQSFAKSIRRADQLAGDAGLAGRMAGVGHDDVFGFRPGPAQIIRAPDRADDVVAALNDAARNRAQALDAAKQRTVGEKEPMHEVMRFDARDRQRDGILVEVRDEIGIRQQRGTRALVAAPGVRRGHMHRRL